LPVKHSPLLRREETAIRVRAKAFRYIPNIIACVEKNIASTGNCKDLVAKAESGASLPLDFVYSERYTTLLFNIISPRKLADKSRKASTD